MKKILFILVFFTGFLANQEVKASHAAGGELTYVWLSGSTYRFTLKFYRDCSGIPQPASFYMCYRDGCSNTFYTQLLSQVVGNLPGGIPNGSAVNTGCSTPTVCQNPSSLIPGFEEWWYQGDVTLPVQCSNWEFWVNEAARNAQVNITGGGGGFNLLIKASLNNLVAQGNNSADFTFKPVPYICINQPWSFNNGAFDIDGDSLSYKSITPYSSNTTTGSATSSCSGSYPAGNVIGAAGFAGYNAQFAAIPSTFFNISPVTGIINAFPIAAAQGKNVITIEVTEWRNGVAISTIIRDIQVACIPCFIANPVSTVNTSSLQGLTYNPLTGNYNSCQGDTLNFCVLITGPIDTAGIVSSNNGAIVLPGSVTTTIGNGTDSVLICTSWISTGNDTGLHVITYLYKDTGCLYNPISVINALSIPIYVFPETEATGSTSICFGDSTTLGVTGGSSFNWTVMPGGSPITSMSCTNCSKPKVWPTVTTSYIVTSNITSSCADNVDTVTVVVAAPIVLNAGPNIVLCPNSTYTMQATCGPLTNTYTYQWAPTTYLSNTTVLNPTIINPQTSIVYTLTAVPNGVAACSVSATMNMVALDGFDIKNNDTTICEGSSVFIATTGVAQYNYTWSPIKNVSNPFIKNPVITPDSTRTYTLTASFPGCPDTAQSITITVESTPKVNIGPDRSLCKWDTLQLLANVLPNVGIPNFYSYAWTPATDLSATTLEDPYFIGLTTNTYTVTVTTPKGCTGTDAVVVLVFPGEFFTPLPDKQLCPGDTFKLTQSGGTSYYWTPNYFLSDSNTASVFAYPPSTTTFTVYGTNADGCKDTATSTIFIAANGVLNAGPDVTNYPGLTAQLGVTGNCINNINWTPSTGLDFNNILNPIANPAVTTQYIITGTTEYGCPATDTIIVNVAPQTLLNLPNAFTPGNGSTINDQFGLQSLGLTTLNYFRIYNRWGELVYDSKDINKGWNGRYKDVPQPMGTYVYQIDATNSKGGRFSKVGNVTLLR
jgi:gliding motility-associated-like protein